MSEDKRRTGKPYIWPTWVTPLLAGTNACWWAAWYRAHYKHEKIKEDGDRSASLAQWTHEHDAMVNARAEELRAKGLLVGVEEDNEFKLEGDTAIISGKPDLVARDVGDALVIDAKSGKPRESDQWQVRIYLAILPIVDPDMKDVTLRGEVQYRGARVPVKLSDEDKRFIFATVKRIGMDDPPARVPSARDCRFCDIAKCPDRYVGKTAKTSAF
jgi:CRISPR/Cas system-associated exonuclease Cas4 (RecB family)